MTEEFEEAASLSTSVRAHDWMSFDCLGIRLWIGVVERLTVKKIEGYVQVLGADWRLSRRLWFQQQQNCCVRSFDSNKIRDTNISRRRTLLDNL